MSFANQAVLIMTDTQRTDMVGCNGNPAMRTPCLDSLAGRGVRFDRAYTCQPVCGPARSALFTGTWPHSNGSWANCMPLGANIRHVGQRMANHSIHTAYIGKWHLDGSDYFGTGRCPEGWDPDYWYDMRRYLEELPDADRARSRLTQTNLDPDLTADFTYGHRCSNRAISFLSKHGGESFLLVVSYDEPHGPCLCPRPYSEMFLDFDFPKSPNVWDRMENKPDHQKAWAGSMRDIDRDALRIRNSNYLGCNAFVDSEIGRVLEAVEKHAPGAMILYTSDHGDAMHSHCLTNKGPAMYDEIARIPFIVSQAGGVPEGAVCSHPVSHIDVVPTLLEAFGLPKAPSLEGESMLSTLRDPAVRPNEAVFMEFGRYETDHDGFGGFQPVRAAFDGRYKLVVNLLATDELYDLDADLFEMENLIDAPDHSQARNVLHSRMLDWMNRTRDPFRGYWWERRPWRSDARPATWDYTGMTRQREDETEPRQLDYGTGLPMTEATRRK